MVRRWLEEKQANQGRYERSGGAPKSTGQRAVRGPVKERWRLLRPERRRAAVPHRDQVRERDRDGPGAVCSSFLHILFFDRSTFWFLFPNVEDLGASGLEDGDHGVGSESRV